MADPAEKSATADPEAWCDNQPEDTPQERAVIDLAESRNNETQEGGVAGSAHTLLTEGRVPHPALSRRVRDSAVLTYA